MEALIQGLKDAAEGKELKLTPEERNEAFREFQTNLRTKQEEERKVLGEKNNKEGAAFLAENAKKEGVKVTESGLQYMVMREGKGANPKATDTVEVHYRGTLLDGTEFDSSYKRGKTAKFPLNRVIKGWTEGLQLMKAGSKFKFFIPYQLAYGERGSRNIAPMAMLTFVVELININPPKEQPKAPPKAPQKKPNPHAKQ
jgi:FKBP-type peptidyl-prolyl cis-trans isomerase